MKIWKNKLPRKRKKAYKAVHGSINYMAARIINDMMVEEGDPCRFPKLKRNPKNPKGFDVVGYW